MPPDDRPKLPRLSTAHDLGKPKQSYPQGVPVGELDKDVDTGAIEDPDVRRVVRGKRPTDQRLEHLEEFKDDTKGRLDRIDEKLDGLDGKLDKIVERQAEGVAKENDALKAESAARRKWWRDISVALVGGGALLKILQAMGLL